MAGADRHPPDALARVLDAAAQTDFVSLVRRIEQSHGFPASVAVGTDGPPRDEAIRFKHDPSLAFSTQDVTSARLVEERIPFSDAPATRHYEVSTTFLGLTGSATPLPLHIAEEVVHEDGDTHPRRDFLDLFHHRLIALLFRGLARSEVDREFRSDASDLHSQRILALIGVDARADEAPSVLSRTELLQLAPILVSGRGTKHAIEASVATIFRVLLDGAPVRVEGLRGGEVEFADDQRMRLAKVNTRLGVDSIIGRRVRHAAGRMAVVIGPVGPEAHRAFSIGGEYAAKLRAVVAFALDVPTDVDIELILREDARPTLTLDRSRRLGRDSFLAGGEGHARVRVGDARASARPGHP